jgi:cytochrome c oxidase assembly protein subunit 15
MYRKWVRIALILVYLVIVAGALVRMTGSGMGCPDWPKCFGYYIPPTEAEQLEWSPARFFEKGQVIILDEQLLVAKSDFSTGEVFDRSNWQRYDKHDYAQFNVWHTWIEYINRLLGALSGLAILIMAFMSLRFWKSMKRITLLSVLSVFLIGFQAWLGATVVYSVLAPVRITLHMVMALVIVAVLIYLLELSATKRPVTEVPRHFKGLMILAAGLTMIQVVMGTQVRQLVDEQVRLVGYELKDRWLEDPTLTFYLHRSFSIVVLALNALLWYVNRKRGYNLALLDWILAFILLEALTGIAMFYFDFPVASQPLHLVIASLLFGLQFYLLLSLFHRKNARLTS